MITVIVAVKDKLTGFMQPVCEQSEEVAARNFSMTIQTAAASSMFGYKPEDFDLYVLGTFDGVTGEIKTLPIPKIVITGSSVLHKEVGEVSA